MASSVQVGHASSGLVKLKTLNTEAYGPAWGKVFWWKSCMETKGKSLEIRPLQICAMPELI